MLTLSWIHPFVENPVGLALSSALNLSFTKCINALNLHNTLTLIRHFHKVFIFIFSTALWGSQGRCCFSHFTAEENNTLNEVSCLRLQGWWVLEATLEPRFLSEHGVCSSASQMPNGRQPSLQLTKADQHLWGQTRWLIFNLREFHYLGEFQDMIRVPYVFAEGKEQKDY